jgi:hypothetical protein
MSEKMGFTEDQLADFQEAFLLFDNKGDGRIPVSVLYSMRYLSIQVLIHKDPDLLVGPELVVPDSGRIWGISSVSIPREIF